MRKLIFTEVLIEIEGYLEDCENNEVKPENRTYTDGYGTITVDWAHRVTIEGVVDIYLYERQWELLD